MQPDPQRYRDAMRLLAFTLCLTTWLIALDSPASEQTTTVWPATSLPWTLVAAFANASPARASAIVAVGEDAQKYVEVGDLIADNIKLDAVADTYIVLINNGAYERLYFKRARTISPSETQEASKAQATSNAKPDSQTTHRESSLSNAEIHAALKASMEHFLTRQQNPDDGA